MSHVHDCHVTTTTTTDCVTIITVSPLNWQFLTLRSLAWCDQADTAFPCFSICIIYWSTFPPFRRTVYYCSILKWSLVSKIVYAQFCINDIRWYLFLKNHTVILPEEKSQYASTCSGYIEVSSLYRDHMLHFSQLLLKSFQITKS